MIGIDELTNHIRRIAQEVVGRSQFKGTLVCTAYNPKTHAVKGIIQPHGIESGWVPVAAIHVGNGFGILVGPRVGDPQKLDGQVFDLHFDGGDPDTLVAHHRQFSTPETPPQVQSGEMLIQHQSGNKVFFDQGNNVTVQHHAGATLVFHDDKTISLQHASGSKIAWDQNGNITHDLNGMSVAFSNTGGVTIDTLNVSGATTLSGSASLGGLPIATLP